MIIASDFKKQFYIFYGLDYTLSFHSFTPHYSSMGKFCLNEVLHLISTQLSHLIMGCQPSSLHFHYRICTMLCQDHSFNLYPKWEPQLCSGGVATWGITTNSSTPDYLRPDKPPWVLPTSLKLFSNALMLIWRLQLQMYLWETGYQYCPPTPLADFLLLSQIQDACQWAYLQCQIFSVSHVQSSKPKLLEAIPESCFPF